MRTGSLFTLALYKLFAYLLSYLVSYLLTYLLTYLLVQWRQNHGNDTQRRRKDEFSASRCKVFSGTLLSRGAADSVQHATGPRKSAVTHGTATQRNATRRYRCERAISPRCWVDVCACDTRSCITGFCSL